MPVQCVTSIVPEQLLPIVCSFKGIVITYSVTMWFCAVLAMCVVPPALLFLCAYISVVFSLFVCFKRLYVCMQAYVCMYVCMRILEKCPIEIFVKVTKALKHVWSKFCECL